MGAREGRQRTVTVSVGGVTVRKELLEDEYTRPAIRFELSNESDEGKSVRLTEPVPEGQSASAMGFHPAHGARYWSCYADRAEYERDLPPETEVATVYGVEVDHVHEAEAFLAEPRLVVDEQGAAGTGAHAGTREGSSPELDVELLDDGLTDGGNDEGPSPGSPVEDSADGGNGGATEPAIDGSEAKASLDIDIPGEPTSSDGLGQSGGDDQAANDRVASEQAANSQAADDRRTVDAMADDAGGVLELSSPTGAPEGPGGGPESGSVVERLVEELKRNDVGSEERKIIREQLDLGVSSMTRARINQLSTRVEKIAAYTDALEEFLDEEGTAQEVIEDFEMQVTALRDDVAHLRDQATSNANDIGTIDDTVASLSSRMEDLEGTLDSVADRADDIEDSLSTTDSHLEAVEADLRQTECQVATNAETIEELDDDVSNVSSDVSAVEGDLEDVEDRVTQTEDDVERLDDTAEDIWEELSDVEDEVDDVAAGLEDVENDVAEVIEWRDQLGETFH